MQFIEPLNPIVQKVQNSNVLLWEDINAQQKRWFGNSLELQLFYYLCFCFEFTQK